MSYKGGFSGRASSSSYGTDDASLYVDKGSVVHYDGNPKLAEEYEERVMLGFQTLDTKDKAGYAAKLKNALFGRAWTLCHKKAEIAASKLLEISSAEATATSGPLAATKLVVKTVRSACERVAPLLKNQAFEDYFFEKGRRRPNEPVSDYIQRRQNEYERLESLSQGHTKLSTDLQAFFLLRNCGASASQQRTILGQAGNEYDWDKITEAMMIQMDAEVAQQDFNRPGKGGKKGLTYSQNIRRPWAFPVEEDEEAYPAEEEYGYDAESEGYQDVWNVSPEEDQDHVFEDLAEFEHSLEVLAVEEMSNEELEVFAAESQKLVRAAPRKGS